MLEKKWESALGVVLYAVNVSGGAADMRQTDTCYIGFNRAQWSPVCTRYVSSNVPDAALHGTPDKKLRELVNHYFC